MKKIYTLIVAFAFAGGLAAQAPTNGLIAYYPFTGGSYNDASGNNHTLADGGLTTAVAGVGGGGAIMLNGLTYLYADNMGTYPAAAYTVSCWAKTDPANFTQTGTYPALVNIGGSQNIGFEQHADDFTSMYGHYVTANGGDVTTLSNIKWDTNGWVNYILTYENGVFRFYVNGENIGALGNQPNAGQRTPTHKLFIGSAALPNGTEDNTRRFVGAVDEIRYYDRALGFNEIGLLYNDVAYVPTLPTFIYQQQQTGANLCPDASISAYKFASGHNVSYQWYLNDVALPDQTYTTVYIDSADADVEGVYYCVATNAAGDDTSATYTVTVSQPTTINVSPGDTMFLCGGATQITLVINATNPDPNTILEYEWYLAPETYLGNNDSVTVTVNEGDIVYGYVNDNCTGYDFTTYIATQNSLTTPAITYANDTLDIAPGNYNTIQWYKDGIAIDGAINDFYIPTANGNYFAIVAAGTCTAASNTLVITDITGIAENEMGAINLYPNPAQGKLYINTDMVKPGTSVGIYNIQGALLSQTNLTVLTTELNIEGLANGYYLIKINTSKGSTTKPFVKM